MLVYLTLSMQVWEIRIRSGFTLYAGEPRPPKSYVRAEKKGVSSLVLYSAPLISRGSEGALPYLPLLLGFSTVVFL